MRFSAIGLPMIPSPMKPTVSAIALPSLEPQVRNRNICAPKLLRQPIQTLLCRLRRRVVFKANVAIVAEVFQGRENVRVADFAGPRLPTFRGVGDLDVPDRVDVLTQLRDQVSFHPLHVVEVVLYSCVLPLNTLYELDRLLCRPQKVRPVLEGVDGLDHDPDTVLSRRIGRQAHVLAGEAQLLLAVHAGYLVPHEYVQPPATHRPRQLQGYRHVLPKLSLPLRVGDEPAIPVRHVSSIEVEECDLDACILDSLLYLAEVLVRRPPELDRREACLCRSPEPIQVRDFFEQDGNVRAEPHTPPLGTSIP